GPACWWGRSWPTNLFTKRKKFLLCSHAALWCLHPVHRGASSRGVVKVGRDAAPARAAQRKPPPRAALGKPPRGTKTAGSVRLAVNAKAVMPRGASRDAGARVMCARDPAIRVRPSNRAVRRNPDNAPSRRATPLDRGGKTEETTGEPPRPHKNRGRFRLRCLTIESQGVVPAERS